MTKSGAPHEAPSPAAEAIAAKRLEREVAELKDQYLRQLADLENTRKRLRRDQTELNRFASEAVIRDVLPIVDSLDQALVAVDPSTRPSTSSGLARDSAPQTEGEAPGMSAGLRKPSETQALITGIHLIRRQLLQLLERQGVKRIATVGEAFDPHQHEAVAEVEADGQAPHTIVEEVQVGYTMNGKVIRPAIVKVAKSTDQTTEQGGSSNG